MTHKTKVEFVLASAVIVANTIIDAKKYFTSDEIESYEKDGYLQKIEIPIHKDLKKETKKVEIISLEEMTLENMLDYAAEIGLDVSNEEDEDLVFSEILGFDYEDLKSADLKKFALIIGANLEGMTKKEQYKEAIEKIKTDYEPQESDD